VAEEGSSRRFEIQVSFQRETAAFLANIISMISKKRAGEGSMTLAATRSR
jgi:hypothetical protein